MKISLEDLVSAYLEVQGLPDCTIVFEPYRAGKRRAKRSTAMVNDALEPDDQAKLQGNRTVQDLLDRFLALSPVMRSWTEGATRYVPRLYNIAGEVVHPSKALSDVRRFAEELEKKNIDTVRRLLVDALHASDRLLEPTQVSSILISLIAKRDGH
jgi:hypothetical protein